MESMSLNSITKAFADHENAIISVFKRKSEILKMAHIILTAVQAGGALYIAGNGGSAADAQHMAAELIGRFRKDRSPIAAIALSTDTSVLTAVGNDYGFSEVFARQVRALTGPQDVLLLISTSGNSQNILGAATQALANQTKVLALTGKMGGQLAKLADCGVCVESDDTAHIQEAHIFIIHCLCRLVEDNL